MHPDPAIERGRNEDRLANLKIALAEYLANRDSLRARRFEFLSEHELLSETKREWLLERAASDWAHACGGVISFLDSANRDRFVSELPSELRLALELRRSNSQRENGKGLAIFVGIPVGLLLIMFISKCAYGH